MIFQQKGAYPAGEHSVPLTEADLVGKGLLWYRLDTEVGSRVRVMVRME